jgi:hypothetical protein
MNRFFQFFSHFSYFSRFIYCTRFFQISIVFLILSLFFSSPSFAEEENLPSYLCKEENKYTVFFQEQESFFALKEYYHAEIKKQFDKNTQSMQKSDVKDGSFNMSSACSPFVQEQETSISQFSSQLYQEYWDYECVLKSIAKNPKIPEDSLYISEGINSLSSQYSLVELERTSARLALAQTIEMYSELREWYPVHKDLICLTSQFIGLRDSLADFINNVIKIPPEFENAMSRYQLS